MKSTDNPYSTSFNDKPISQLMRTTDQQKKYENEEQDQKAPPTLPFELDHLIAKLGDTFVDLTEIRRMIDNVKQNKSVDQDKVDNLQDKIDQINNLILELPEDVAKLSL